MLLRYIITARPVFAAESGTASSRLWLTNHGQPYTAHYISNRVAIVTERELGVRSPVHFFRDIAATTLAREAPQAARLIRPLLGHAGFATAEEHYIHATTIDAGRRHAAAIEQILVGKKGTK
jgi:integrase